MGVYTAWSVVFGEQPTAAKWNQLGTNDAGFKDGSNIDDDAIIARHLADSAVEADSIASEAILLGRAKRTSNFNTSSTGAVQVTDLEVTVDVPEGGRDLLVELTIYRVGNNTANTAADIGLWDGAISGGTLIGQGAWSQPSGVSNLGYSVVARGLIESPAAGSKTIRASALTSGGTLTLVAGTNNPAILTVMAV